VKIDYHSHTTTTFTSPTLSPAQLAYTVRSLHDHAVLGCPVRQSMIAWRSSSVICFSAKVRQDGWCSHAHITVHWIGYMQQKNPPLCKRRGFIFGACKKPWSVPDCLQAVFGRCSWIAPSRRGRTNYILQGDNCPVNPDPIDQK